MYLVRDPRAVMSSRNGVMWCSKDPNCRNVEHLCNDTWTDLPLMEKLTAERPDRYYFLKYEDLALKMVAESKKLFDFLGLTFTPSVEAFIESHTRVNDIKKAHST